MMLNRSKVLRGYIKSFSLLTIAVGLTVGLLILFFGISSMRRMERENLQARLQLSTDYLSQQIEKVDAIANQTKFKRVYQPFYFTQNRYYHLELIKDFAMAKGNSPLLKNYYLMYPQLDSVFSGLAHWNTEKFLSVEVGVTRADFMEKLLNSENQYFFTLSDGRLVYVKPVHIGSPKDTRGDAFFIVLLTSNDLSEMIKSIGAFQELPGFTIKFMNKCVLGIDEKEGEDRLFASAKKVPLTLSILDNGDIYSEKINSFQRTVYLIMILLIISYMSIAVVLAYNHYKPIHHLYSSFVSDKLFNNDEFKDLERIIDKSLQDKSSIQAKLNEQIQMLRVQENWLLEQQVLLLVNGETSEQTVLHFEKLGVDLHHRYFAICFTKVGVTDDTELNKRILALSDDEVSYCCVRIPSSDGHMVLINFDDRQQLSEYCLMLRDIFDSMSMNATFSVSTIGQGIHDIPSLALEAISSYEGRMKKDKNKEEIDDFIQMNNLDALFDALDTKNEMRALSLTDEMLNRIESQYTSLLLRNHIVIKLWTQLKSFAEKLGLKEDTDESFFNTTHDMNCVRTYIHSLVVSIINMPEHNAENSSNEPLKNDIVAYIEDHSLDNDISQASVADAFNISLRQVSRILKNNGYPPFREYVIHLRIEEAKRLLREENITITETAERTGFNNISHFVHTFRESVGITPGEYKKSIGYRH